MLSADLLAGADKSALQTLAESLSAAELETLVPLLSDKDDKRRYARFLVLQHRSAVSITRRKRRFRRNFSPDGKRGL